MSFLMRTCMGVRRGCKTATWSHHWNWD